MASDLWEQGTQTLTHEGGQVCSPSPHAYPHSLHTHLAGTIAPCESPAYLDGSVVSLQLLA